MNNFSIARVGLLLRRDILQNWKDFLKYMGLFYAAVLCAEIMILCTDTTEELEYALRAHFENVRLNAVCQNICLLFYLWAIVGTSYTFSCLRTQAKRATGLMLPATKGEKFVSLLLTYSVVWWMGSVVAVFAADLTRFICLLPTKHHYSLVWGNMLPYVGDLFSDVYEIVTQVSWSEGRLRRLLILITAFPWTASVFLLGSSLFRKRPLILTILSLIMVWALLAGLTAAIGNTYGASVFQTLYSADADAKPYLFIEILIFFTLCFVNIYGAYRIFGRTQIIRRRWWGFRKAKR